MIFLILGIPIAFSLLLTSVTLILYKGMPPLIVVSQRLSNSLNSFPLLAIPLFILTAQIMNESGATEKIFDLANVIVGRITGGLAHVNVLASMLFSGMSGSAVADASGLGMIEIKAMFKEGYSKSFAASVTAASSTIGPIIPPSVPMVIYGVVSGTSISALFLAGAVPGILMGFAMMVLIYFISRKRKIGIDNETPSKAEVKNIILESAPSLLLPVIILGGIWGGIFSPTEAAAVAVTYALILGIFFYRNIKLKDIPGIFLEAGHTTAAIMLIVAAANLYGWLVSVEQIPQLIQQGILSFSTNPIVVMLIINLILLIAGMFMELIAILTIAVPVFLPIATSVGIDPVFFGVIAVLNLMIGLLTPPFGLNIYILQRVSKVPFWDITKEVFPFILLLIGFVILLVIFPEIVMFLPNLIAG